MAVISDEFPQGMTLDELRAFLGRADMAGVPGKVFIRTRNKFGGGKGAKVTMIRVDTTELREEQA